MHLVTLATAQRPRRATLRPHRRPEDHPRRTITRPARTPHRPSTSHPPGAVVTRPKPAHPAFALRTQASICSRVLSGGPAGGPFRRFRSHYSSVNLPLNPNDLRFVDDGRFSAAVISSRSLGVLGALEKSGHYFLRSINTWLWPYQPLYGNGQNSICSHEKFRAKVSRVARTQSKPPCELFTSSARRAGCAKNADLKNSHTVTSGRAR